VSAAPAQYVRFLSSGVAAGVASVAVLEVLRYVLDAQGGWRHALAVSVAYVVGAVVSYQMQQRYVFSARVGGGVCTFVAFFALTVALSLVVGALSTALLGVDPVHAFLGAAAPAVTLVIAALAVSPLSFGATRFFFQRVQAR
jgi:putative flippase GtrA